MTLLLKLIILILLTVISFWISSICGGGASLILIPLLNLMLAPAYVPFTLTIGTFTSSASRIIVFKKHIEWKIFKFFFPLSVPGVFLGAWLMKYFNPLYLEILVAIFLLTNLPELFKSKTKYEKEEKPYSNFTLGCVGFMAGFVSGITGAIGLLFNRFYLRYGLTKEQIIATRAANEIFLHTVKIIIYVLLGLHNNQALIYGLVIALGAVVSSYLIQFIIPYISEFIFRKVGYGAMVFSGLFLLINTSSTIIQKDKISIQTNPYNETVMNWRESQFVLEFSIGEGLEIERQIKPTELPDNLKIKYKELLNAYDNIFLEIVYGLEGKKYEFYCYKGNNLSKFEFE